MIYNGYWTAINIYARYDKNPRVHTDKGIFIEI